MRMSCNGCRVLRKGCSDNCSIRPCLQWIKSPESQANATVFLAKFYGRAGLMNLINAGPDHLRPAIFRSLLYEACGRIVNPIYGSVGLLWSGSWQLCQAAVEAVLKGAPITPINSEAAANGQGPPLKAYDIRHVSKDDTSAANSLEPGKPRARTRSRRAKPKAEKPGTVVIDMQGHDELTTRSTSHESSAVSHQSEPAAAAAAADAGESKEIQSMEMAEAPLFRSEPVSTLDAAHDNDSSSSNSASEMALELTLGFEPVSRACHVIPVKKRRLEANSFKVELGLDFTRVN